MKLPDQIIKTQIVMSLPKNETRTLDLDDVVIPVRAYGATGAMTVSVDFITAWHALGDQLEELGRTMKTHTLGELMAADEDES